jgi:flagellar FliL protein
MADAVEAPSEAPPKKGLFGRLLVPILMLVGGAAAGAAGAVFMPTLIPMPAADKAPEPEVAPLQYVEIPTPFTANLKDTGRFVQVKIAISTQGGQPVVDAVERHQVAIVSEVLGVLTDTAEEELATTAGREALTRRMRLGINDVLQRKSGLAGVDDVFLTSFILQ